MKSVLAVVLLAGLLLAFTGLAAAQSSGAVSGELIAGASADASVSASVSAGASASAGVSPSASASISASVSPSASASAVASTTASVSAASGAAGSAAANAVGGVKGGMMGEIKERRDWYYGFSVAAHSCNAEEISALLGSSSAEATDLATAEAKLKADAEAHVDAGTFQADVKAFLKASQKARLALHKNSRTITKEQRAAAVEARRKCVFAAQKLFFAARGNQELAVLAKWQGVSDDFAAKGFDATKLNAFLAGVKADLTAMVSASASATDESGLKSIQVCLFNDCRQGKNEHMEANFFLLREQARFAKLEADNPGVASVKIDAALSAEAAYLTSVDGKQYADGGAKLRSLNADVRAGGMAFFKAVREARKAAGSASAAASASVAASASASGQASVMAN